MFTCGERKTVNFSLLVGRGIGPLTSAPVLFAVSTISIEDFNGNNYSTPFYGAWGLFKVLNSNISKLEKNGNNFDLKFSAGSMSALFKLNTTANIKTIKLTYFKNLKYPEFYKKESLNDKR